MQKNHTGAFELVWLAAYDECSAAAIERPGRSKMYKNLLIATDGSELSLKAVEQGLALAKALNAKATAVTVTEPWTAMASGDFAMSFPVEEYEQSVEASAQKILAGASEVAKKVGAPCNMLHVKDHFPAEGIIETADKLGCDLIVMSSHGRRGITRLLMGSQANNVLTHSKMPVLICR
jgi:nucleotide-binding universal stress UspA family protein